MGCAASKLDNEDTVRRCKERRRLMKEAVFARHHLAASHSDYCRSLRLTGAALSAFAAGEPLQVLNSTPPVVLSRSSTLPSTPSLRRPSPPRSQSLRRPPPSPASDLPPVVPASVASPTRRHKSIRVPHILSDSSPSSSPRSHVSSAVPGGNKHHFPTYYAVPNTSYSSTPSQTSSLWNWENFRPPSPPGSEYYHPLRERTNPMDTHRSETLHPRDPADSEFSHRGGRYIPTESKNAGFYGGVGDDDDDRRSRLHRGDEMEREEVQCSEWDDHYSTTSSSSSDGDLDADADRDSVSEMGIRSRFGSSAAETPAPQPPSFPGIKKPEKFDDAGSSVSWNAASADGGAGMKMVVSHKDLKEILDATKEYFDKEAAAGERLSEMLEIGRAQLDRSFSQLKKTLYHSSNVFSNLSSNWTSKPPLAVKYQLNTSSLVESGGSKSLLSTLERLLAWEKKLYEEVKAREGAKIGHEKKLSTLQSQEYKGDQAKLDKTKASIKRLQSIIIVTSQAVSTTSSAISSLKDTDLLPVLIGLCHELKYMWRAMNEYHESQSGIIQQVGGLVNRAVKGDMTTDLHRQVTRELESAVSAWQSSFDRLIKYQRQLIHSLHGWFKLTVIPISDDHAQGTQGSSEVLAFLDEWKNASDRVPHTVASDAIKSFVNVVHAISAKQAEELKIKKRTEAVSKELEKKARGIRNLEMKFYQSYSMVGVGLQNTQPDNGHLVDSQDPLAEKKLELAACRRRVDDEMLKHSKAVEVTRSMTLTSIQTGLPGVFQTMTSFSGVCVDALEAVCTRSYAIK